MNKTKIEWCDSTWNPVTGCRHGCEYCYAEKIAKRFGKFQSSNFCTTDQLENYETAFEIYEKPDNPYPFLFAPSLHIYRLDKPQRKTKQQNIFVCSMADLFGNWVPDSWIDEIMKACAEAPQHNYLFLTKNPKRYESISDNSKNLWYGATATDENSFIVANDCFMQQKVNTEKHFNTFLSIEPIQSEIKINDCDGYFSCLDWVIIGAETGNRKDKIIPKKKWIDHIVEQCGEFEIPVFMKDSLILIIGEENMRRKFPKELVKK